MKMKKLIAVILLILMMISAATAEKPLVGGWKPSADPTITEDLQSLFEKGTATLTGMGYIPVVYLGSQVVAGTNHAFLCQAVTAYPGSIETAPAYAIIYLYENLRGEVSILNIADFDIGSLCTY